MFKMKYLIKKCNATFHHIKWGGLIVRVFTFIPKVNRSNLMSGVVCDQHWFVDQRFSYVNPIIGA
jgi:hypothetical protein